jgi:hypothetical protein
LTAGEIVQKLHRSPGAIRNLRYKKHLVTRVQDESKALFHQRDELINVVKSLQGQKTSLAFEVEYLKKEKGRLGAVIAIDKARLEETLAQALMNLKNAEARLVHSVRSGANSCAVESVLEIARAKCDSWI